MPAHRKTLINPIWTPALAYAVGLLVTDGNLSKDGRHINFRSSDLDLIETFKRCLDLKAKTAENSQNTYGRKPCFLVQWSDVALYLWLTRIGLMPAKSLIIGSVNLPDEFFRDFLRGHSDGDGTVMSYIDNSNNYRNRNYTAIRLYLKFISASRSHLEWLMSKIQSQVSAKGSFEARVKMINDKPHYINTIKYSKKKALILLNWIYYQEDLPSLQRKAIFARQLMTEILHRPRKIYSRL